MIKLKPFLYDKIKDIDIVFTLNAIGLQLDFTQYISKTLYNKDHQAIHINLKMAI